MELTDDMLERIAFSIVYLKTRMDLLQTMVMHNDRGLVENFEDLVNEAVTTMKFQTACDELRESWKKGTPTPVSSFLKL